MFADICTGLISILTPETIGAVALGIFTGLMFGAIPGISGIMAISILLPLTFYVSPLVGIPMLLGIYKAMLLPKPGNGVRRGKLRVVVQRLLILKIGVCLERGFFRFCRRPVWFQLAAAAALSHLPRPRPDAALG